MSFAGRAGASGGGIASLSMLVFLLFYPAVAEAVIRPVRDIQQALAAKGFDPGTPDGMWGTKSVAALRAFQKGNGLPETGVVNDQCLSLLLPAEPVQQDSEVAPTSQDKLPAALTQVASTAPSGSALATSPQLEPTGKSKDTESGGGMFAAVILGIGGLFFLIRKRRPRS